MDLIPTQSNGLFYIDGCVIYNDATTPDEIVNVSPGRCAAMSVSDSNVSFDTTLTTAIAINNTVAGVNGLDTGSVAASKVYAVYLIASQAGTETPAGLLSLSLTDPVMPAGANGTTYDLKRLIGFVATDASSDFLLFKMSGQALDRTISYVSTQSVLSAGASQTFADVDLSAFVPAIEHTKVTVQVSFTPNGAGDAVSLAPFGENPSTAVAISGSVASVAQDAPLTMASSLDSGIPKILYKNSAASGATDLAVYSYDFTLANVHPFIQ